MFLPKLKMSSSIVLPTVYSDALSYGEELNKIKWYINRLIDGTELSEEGIKFKGVTDKFDNTIKEEGYWYVDATNADQPSYLPPYWWGKGMLFVLKTNGSTGYQAILFTTDGEIYTTNYDETAGDWNTEWKSGKDNKLVFYGTINDFSQVQRVDGNTGVYSVRNENAVGFPDDSAGTWTFGTMIILKNNLYNFAFLTASNGHTYTRFYHAGTWSDWRSDYGAITDLTDSVDVGVTMGEHSYLKYRLMGHQVFVDGEFNSVMVPSDNDQGEPVYIVESGLPHHSNWGVLLPFIANAGKITGTCMVSVSGALRVMEAFDNVTGTRMNSSLGGTIPYMQIHATYCIN